MATAREKCFANWFLQGHMDTELYREFTIVLAREFRTLSYTAKGKTLSSDVSDS